MHNKIPTIFTFISEFKKEKILKLNKDIGIIFRNYDKPDDKEVLLSLKKFCKKNQRKLYLANNFKMAVNLDLDGVYIPSYNKKLRIKNFTLKKNFLILGSAHNLPEIFYKKKQGVNLIFLSPLFKTKNYKKILGIIKFNILSRLSNEKIIALGGINEKNLNNLKIIKACGFSGISYFNRLNK
tara:strand:+ start:469 stop:1014 length:546 start_codon:yes stop_codon:yes gene_type:complete